MRSSTVPTNLWNSKLENNQNKRIAVAEKGIAEGLQRFFLFWFPLIGYMVLIFILSSQPALEDIPDIWNIDKLIHFMTYGVLSILLFRVLKRQRAEVRNKQLIFLSFLFATLYGISNEIHQHFIPHRTASIADALANGLGAFVFPLLYIKIPMINILKRFL
jgi:VanZ family protein